MSRIHDLEKLLNYRDLRKKIISIKNELSDNENISFHSSLDLSCGSIQLVRSYQVLL